MVTFRESLMVVDANTANLEKILEKLRKDCAPFLKEVKGAKRLLWRGIRKPMGLKSVIVKRRRRKKRRPLSTSIELHNRLDVMFKDKFKWKARSEGVFATPVKSSAYFFSGFKESNGAAYLFFPIGNYSYIWNPDVSDLYSRVRENMLDSDIMKIVNGYIKTGLKEVASMGDFTEREIMFNVDNYYLVKGEYKESLEKELL